MTSKMAYWVKAMAAEPDDLPGFNPLGFMF